MRPANERRRYNVTSSLIGSAHSRNDQRSLFFENMVLENISTDFLIH